jgi:hypothetical protein
MLPWYVYVIATALGACGGFVWGIYTNAGSIFLPEELRQEHKVVLGTLRDVICGAFCGFLTPEWIQRLTPTAETFTVAFDWALLAKWELYPAAIVGFSFTLLLDYLKAKFMPPSPPVPTPPETPPATPS